MVVFSANFTYETRFVFDSVEHSLFCFVCFFCSVLQRTRVRAASPWECVTNKSKETDHKNTIDSKHLKSPQYLNSFLVKKLITLSKGLEIDS